MATNEVQSIEFFKVHVPHINSKILRLPLGVNRYITQPLPETAILRNHNGNPWRVSFKRRNEFLCFEGSWTSFLQDNELKPMEFMVFVYEPPNTFLVSIYGLSTCREKRGHVVIIEPPEDTEEDANDVGDSSFSLQSEDETRHGRHRKSHDVRLGNPRRHVSETPAFVERAHKYLDDPANPFFVTELKNRNFELLVPSQVVKDHHLKFSKSIHFIDSRGEMTSRYADWKDQRVCFKEWNRICRRNNVKPQDKVICELQKAGDVVHSIKVHIIRRGNEAT